MVLNWHRTVNCRIVLAERRNRRRAAASAFKAMMCFFKTFNDVDKMRACCFCNAICCGLRL